MNLISFTVYIFEPEAAVLNLGIMFKLFSLPHEKKLSKTKQNIGSIDFLNPRIFESILWNVGHEKAVLINIWILSINIHKKCIILTYVLKQFLRYGWSVREYANIHVILFLMSDWGLNRSTNVIGSVKICCPKFCK